MRSYRNHLARFLAERAWRRRPPARAEWSRPRCRKTPSSHPTIPPATRSQSSAQAARGTRLLGCAVLGQFLPAGTAHNHQGTVGQKWGVLNALFERIVVHDGKVVGFKPRADRTAKVRVLIQTARDYAFGFDGEMDNQDGPGAATLASSGSGKGGMTTVDWQYRIRMG